MSYDFDRILLGMQSPETETTLSATVAMQRLIQEEAVGGRTDWASVIEASLQVLIRTLGHPYKGVQVHAATCLELLSLQSQSVLPALREAVIGGDLWQAWGAAHVLARLKLWYPEMAPALRSALGSIDKDVRWAAAGHSLQLGRKYPAAVVMVREALRDANPLARKMAAYTLGAVGTFNDVEADLAGCLGDADRDVRRAVILAINKLPRVSPAVQQRIAALRRDPDEFIRRTASVVAAKFGLA